MPMAESCLQSDGALFMSSMLQIAISGSSGNCCIYGKDAPGRHRHNIAMAKAPKKPKHPRNTLREWREFREMTQEQLAAAVRPPTNASVISLIENRERGLSNKWLERLAPALRTRKGFLIDVDPNSIDTQVLQAWVDISDHDKPRALSILEALKQKA